LCVLAPLGCHEQRADSPATAADPPKVKAFSLPGATGAVSLDYIACDRGAGRVWIPAGGTGSVDVLEIANGSMKRIEGFPTVSREVHGAMRQMGPSSVTLGEGFAYVGNRANSSVCAVSTASLTLGACLELKSSPDGLQYVAATKEVWVTTPRVKSITVLDASDPAKLAVKSEIALEGEPEGYAVDEAKGLFFTNLEDKDKTLSIDVKTHAVKATWEARCGTEGPRGLALDAAKNLLFVACTDHVETLDVANGGAIVARLETGAGVDNIDFLAARRLLFVAAGKAERLTVARVDEKGALTLVATAATAPGTRVVVADESGAAYVGDPMQGRVLAFARPP
jgi:hypothetical protein